MVSCFVGPFKDEVAKFICDPMTALRDRSALLLVTDLLKTVEYKEWSTNALTGVSHAGFSNLNASLTVGRAKQIAITLKADELKPIVFHARLVGLEWKTNTPDSEILLTKLHDIGVENFIRAAFFHKFVQSLHFTTRRLVLLGSVKSDMETAFAFAYLFDDTEILLAYKLSTDCNMTDVKQILTGLKEG